MRATATVPPPALPQRPRGGSAFGSTQRLDDDPETERRDEVLTTSFSEHETMAAARQRVSQLARAAAPVPFPRDDRSIFVDDEEDIATNARPIEDEDDEASTHARSIEDVPTGFLPDPETVPALVDDFDEASTRDEDSGARRRRSVGLPRYESASFEEIDPSSGSAVNDDAYVTDDAGEDEPRESWPSPPPPLAQEPPSIEELLVAPLSRREPSPAATFGLNAFPSPRAGAAIERGPAQFARTELPAAGPWVPPPPAEAPAAARGLPFARTEAPYAGAFPAAAPRTPMMGVPYNPPLAGPVPMGTVAASPRARNVASDPLPPIPPPPPRTNALGTYQHRALPQAQPVGHQLVAPEEPQQEPSKGGRFTWFVFGAAFGIFFAFCAMGFLPHFDKPEAAFPPPAPLPVATTPAAQATVATPRPTATIIVPASGTPAASVSAPRVSGSASGPLPATSASAPRAAPSASASAVSAAHSAPPVAVTPPRPPPVVRRPAPKPDTDEAPKAPVQAGDILNQGL